MGDGEGAADGVEAVDATEAGGTGTHTVVGLTVGVLVAGEGGKEAVKAVNWLAETREDESEG